MREHWDHAVHELHDHLESCRNLTGSLRSYILRCYTVQAILKLLLQWMVEVHPRTPC
jgi:hypothetical protein